VNTVLYAPTWEGHYADTNYGSLPVGPDIVRELLSRGMTVIFRPHPFSYRNPEARENIREIHRLLEADTQATGRPHLYRAPAEKDLDAFGCFNAADAMISDVSSVVPDFLYSGKPYGLVTMTSTVDEFERAFPLARSAYVITKDLTNLEAALDELLVTDSKADQRKSTREYYLGPFAPENYADAFVDAARHVVNVERKPVAAYDAHVEEEEGQDRDETTGTEADAEEDSENRSEDGQEA